MVKPIEPPHRYLDDKFRPVDTREKATYEEIFKIKNDNTVIETVELGIPDVDDDT